MKPEWLTIRPPKKPLDEMKGILKSRKLHTVCEESHCPNMPVCWDNKTATFLIMGNTCTRHCRFCAVKSGKPKPLNMNEPEGIAKAAKEMGLEYAVITSVDRDDLPDKGAAHFAECIRMLKKGGIAVEALIPDYGENELRKVASACPDMIAHNLEVVERLQGSVRDKRAGYQESLNTLKCIKRLCSSQCTKSSLMLGIGETKKEVIEAMEELGKAGVGLVTLGQYLAPGKSFPKVERYVTPEEFAEYKREGERMGLAVESGPFVRSSFNAKGMWLQSKNREDARGKKCL